MQAFILSIAVDMTGVQAMGVAMRLSLNSNLSAHPAHSKIDDIIQDNPEAVERISFAF